LLLSSLTIVFLAAASAEAAKPTPKPTATPAPANTPTPLATKTPTPRPTATPAPPGAVSIAITEPANGATIDSDRVNVRGTFSGPSNTGVTVNGLVAYTYGGRFASNEVALVPGSNTIQVVVTALDGRTATGSITVVATGRPPAMHVVADVTTGFAPLTVTFGYQRTSTAALTKFAIDFDGDGHDDFSTRKSLPTSIHNTYTTPGLYKATLTLLDANGVTARADVSILVEAESARDDLFTSIWNAMNTALVNQNVSGALGYLNQQAQESYASVFQDLLTEMPAIVASYSQPQRLSVTGDVLEYAVNRTIDGKSYIFLVYAMRDGDGVWRFDSM